MSFIARYIAGVLVLIFAVLAAVGVLAPAPPPPPPAAIEPARLSPTALPAVDRTAWPSLVERSPFDPARSAFSRTAAPPPPALEVRLAGVFKVGKELRASLVVGNQTITVRKGDQTPAGVISAIEPSAVVVEGTSTQRIDLFKQ